MVIFINILNTTALKLALEKENYDIYNYLLNLPEIEIGPNCFSNCSELIQFKVPNSVTFIGDCAFEGCKNLINIDIPSSVKKIGDNAFNRCSSLGKIIIPSSVTSIGNNFICYCNLLSSIIIPSSIKNIGRLRFKDFSLLKEFVIPPCITKIGKNDFKGCSSLIKIEIPSSVTSIEKFAFCNCSSLKQITLPPSITSIEEGTFSGCTSLQIVNIPNSIKTIGNNAFFGCTSLVDIIIPSSVNEINFASFKNCTSLNKIIYKNDLENLKINYEVPEYLKTAFVGDIDSGKTCFAIRYTENVFQEDTQPTDGAHFYTKDIEYRGYKMCVMLWDVAGNKSYEGLIEMYIRNLNCAAVFFNLNKRESFDRCKFFLDCVRDASSHAPLVLIGNKCDLEHKVDEKDIIELAKEYNAKYIEVSVKNGHNFEKVFDYLTAEVVDSVVDEKNRLLNLISSDK